MRIERPEWMDAWRNAVRRKMKISHEDETITKEKECDESSAKIKLVEGVWNRRKENENGRLPEKRS